ncbi:MAG: hypothetical protein K1X67_04485 [Fimbriimonadaceae bacterium]|nr:hypothetical protein [Fimbriimonadaceae bacterium]
MEKIIMRVVAAVFVGATAVLIWAQGGSTGAPTTPAGQPAQATNQQKGGVSNPRWEYRVESLELITGTNERSRNDPEGLRMRQQAVMAGMAREAELKNTVFKALGDAGWELVSTYAYNDASAEEIGVRTNVRFVFKRKIGEVSVSPPEKKD